MNDDVIDIVTEHGSASPSTSMDSEIGIGFDEEQDWARSGWSALKPYHTSVYVSFLVDEGRIRFATPTGRPNTSA
ncbi:MAG: hypothetical protein ACRDWS_08795 [Acidimicrobiia bacterium]